MRSNTAAFAVAMKRILDDPAAAAAMGKTGREHVIKKFSLQVRVVPSADVCGT